MKSATAKATGVTEILQVMGGKEKVMGSHKLAQSGRTTREEHQYSGLRGKSLNGYCETVGHHHQSRKEDLQ